MNCSLLKQHKMWESKLNIINWFYTACLLRWSKCRYQIDLFLLLALHGALYHKKRDMSCSKIPDKRFIILFSVTVDKQFETAIILDKMKVVGGEGGFFILFTITLCTR